MCEESSYVTLPEEDSSLSYFSDVLGRLVRELGGDNAATLQLHARFTIPEGEVELNASLLKPSALPNE